MRNQQYSHLTEPMEDAPKAILPYFSTGFGGYSHKNPPKVHRANRKSTTPCDPIKHSTPCVRKRRPSERNPITVPESTRLADCQKSEIVRLRAWLLLLVPNVVGVAFRLNRAADVR